MTQHNFRASHLRRQLSNVSFSACIASPYRFPATWGND